jgi:hypothetical protein
MMKVLVSALFLLLVNVPAHAQRVSTTTGNDLLESCESKDFKEAFCLGYISGVTDTQTLVGSGQR